MASSDKWQFAAHFRRNAFGWRSDMPILRIKEALSEIKQIARKDAITAANGAVTLLENCRQRCNMLTVPLVLWAQRSTRPLILWCHLSSKPTLIRMFGNGGWSVCGKRLMKMRGPTSKFSVNIGVSCAPLRSWPLHGPMNFCQGLSRFGTPKRQDMGFSRERPPAFVVRSRTL